MIKKQKNYKQYCKKGIIDMTQISENKRFN